MRIRVAALAACCAAVGALACDAGLAPEPVCAQGLVGICGTVHFRGSIPDSTDNVFIAAYVTFPQTCNDLIFGRTPLIPPSVPYADSVTTYSVDVPANQYAWVVAAWKKLGTLHLDARDTSLLRVAGYYRSPADTAQPGSVTVPSGGAMSDVDMVVDFDAMQPATDFVTCTLR